VVRPVVRVTSAVSTSQSSKFDWGGVGFLLSGRAWVVTRLGWRIEIKKHGQRFSERGFPFPVVILFQPFGLTGLDVMCQ
jgi:hypothetical protein